IERGRAAYPRATPVGGAKRPLDATLAPSHPAPRFEEGAALATVAQKLGMPDISTIISNALNADRATSTISSYRAELTRFLQWRSDPGMHNLPLSKARNLYLAKCAHDGRQKSLPLVVAALNYFCGALSGVDSEIQHSILEAEKRNTPRVTHRTKIDQQSMRRLVLEGNNSPDPKVTQAATLALLQFKGLLRISEAQALRVADLRHKGDGLYNIFINQSKTDQYKKGVEVACQLDGGGAASLALSLGVEQASVMQAGRWKSLDAFRCYIAPKPLHLPTNPAD
ncbi:hypothetical protein ANCDUO_21360, partial [Ancylostoma duodenale]